MPIFFPTTITGKPAASGGPKVITYRTQDSQTSTTTTYTFNNGGSGYAIGTASSDRLVIVAVNLTISNRTVSSMTIGGVSATNAVRSQRGLACSEIWAAMVSSGTTANISITCSGTNDRCGIIIWTATGMSTATAVGSGSNTSATSPHATSAFATSNGGFVVMTSCDNGGSATYTESVSGGGTPAITEDYDGIFSGSPTMVGARTAATDGTNITVTITGGTNANGGMCAASF